MKRLQEQKVPHERHWARGERAVAMMTMAMIEREICGHRNNEVPHYRLRQAVALTMAAEFSTGPLSIVLLFSMAIA